MDRYESKDMCHIRRGSLGDNRIAQPHKYLCSEVARICCLPESRVWSDTCPFFLKKSIHFFPFIFPIPSSGTGLLKFLRFIGIELNNFGPLTMKEDSLSLLVSFIPGTLARMPLLSEEKNSIPGLSTRPTSIFQIYITWYLSCRPCREYSLTVNKV